MNYVLGILVAIGIMAFIVLFIIGFFVAYNIIHYVFFEASKNTNGDIDECIGCKNYNCKTCIFNDYKGD